MCQTYYKIFNIPSLINDFLVRHYLERLLLDGTTLTHTFCVFDGKPVRLTKRSEIKFIFAIYKYEYYILTTFII